MLNYTLTVNSVDITSFIERDSYRTSKTPVYSTSVTTMDGVTHVVNLRNKGEVSFALNPQNATDTATICQALLPQPCEVYYFNLQTQAYELANMTLDSQSAEYLSYCLFKNQNWNQLAEITLTEL